MVPKIIPSHGLIAAFQAALCPCSESPMPALSTGVWPEDGRRERGYPPHSEALQDGTEGRRKGGKKKRERRPPPPKAAKRPRKDGAGERGEKEEAPPSREAPKRRRTERKGKNERKEREREKPPRAKRQTPKNLRIGRQRARET